MSISSNMWCDILSTNFAVTVLFFLVLVLFVRAISRPAHLPPGPRPWPVIGNFLSLRGDMLQALQNLRREYGDVYLLYMGNHPTVFVHRQKYVQEVLVTRGEEFLDRAKLFFSDSICNNKGIVGSSGQLWKEQRRFTLHTLRNFGFGKSSLESKVMEEIEVLIQCLKDKAGETFQIGKLIHKSVANIICSIVFGSRFEHDDPKFVNYLKLNQKNIERIGFAGPVNFVPWLQYIPGDFFNIAEILNYKRVIENFLMEQIISHKDTLNPNSPRDFIDAYLIEMDKCQKIDENSTFEDEQLMRTIGDLFVAGSESTATTLLWALLYLINYPEVQTKLRSEIHSVVGREGFPSVTDRKAMPYMEATLMEIHRCGDISPLGAPHAAVADTTLKGYHIPKGTTVITVLQSLHRDSEYWENPEVFDPCRFLDVDGNVTKTESFLPFSAGKRVCLGEPLAKMEVFLFLTTMLQRFEFKAPEGMSSLPEERVMGITVAPVPYSLRAVLDV